LIPTASLWQRRKQLNYYKENAMATEYQYEKSGLQFEEFPARSDIRVSKVLTTPGGDKIRAVITTGRSTILTSAGEPNGDSVIIVGDPGELAFSLGDIWDRLKELALKKAGSVLGGGGGQCTSTTTMTVEVGKTTVTTTTMCTAA
jgi:hypothetical protein